MQSFQGHETVWYAGHDVDSSTYMIRLPKERLTVACLSNNPLGDAEGRYMAILNLLGDAGYLSKRE